MKCSQQDGCPRFVVGDERLSLGLLLLAHGPADVAAGADLPEAVRLGVGDVVGHVGLARVERTNVGELRGDLGQVLDGDRFAFGCDQIADAGVLFVVVGVRA